MDAGTIAARDARWLRASLAAVWFLTAITVLHPTYVAIGTEYLARLGLPPSVMYATCAAELVLALWVLRGPTSGGLAALQASMVLGFSIVLALLEPMLLVSPFGVLSKNLQFVAVVAVAWMIEREGWSARAERLLAVAMAAIWVTEGLFPKILFQQAVELDMAPRAGLTFAPPWLLVGALGVAQVASGVAALLLPRRPRRWLLLAQAIALGALPLLVGWSMPSLWVHPFGPFTKNLPILAGTWILYRRCGRPS